MCGKQGVSAIDDQVRQLLRDVVIRAPHHLERQVVRELLGS